MRVKVLGLTRVGVPSGGGAGDGLVFIKTCGRLLLWGQLFVLYCRVEFLSHTPFFGDAMRMGDNVAGIGGAQTAVRRVTMRW
jgi:hypothetical protein